MITEVAHDLVERYRQVRGDSKKFVHEAKELDVWLDILDSSGTRRHP